MQIRQDQRIRCALWEWPTIPNDYSHSKSSRTSRHAETMPKCSLPKAFRGERQCKLPGFRLGGPWSGIQPYSLEVFSNYSGTVCTSSVTIIQGPLFRELCVPEFGAWENGYEGVYALGEQWLLYTEWGPAGIFVHDRPGVSIHERKWTKRSVSTLSVAAADVLTLRQKPKNPSPCVLPPFDWPSYTGKDRRHRERQQYIARSHLDETIK